MPLDPDIVLKLGPIGAGRQSAGRAARRGSVLLRRRHLLHEDD